MKPSPSVAWKLRDSTLLAADHSLSKKGRIKFRSLGDWIRKAEATTEKLPFIKNSVVFTTLELPTWYLTQENSKCIPPCKPIGNASGQTWNSSHCHSPWKDAYPHHHQRWPNPQTIQQGRQNSGPNITRTCAPKFPRIWKVLCMYECPVIALGKMRSITTKGCQPYVEF